ncbi:hypothetical protein GCM10009798_24860 [Nocardioides panacihumi]|uniref:Terpene cyclase/mutase family protein n=1 Tax=Nocardioides panacihumi TaxID=400774 RepID=A0ABP5CGU8_9ACTN
MQSTTRRLGTALTGAALALGALAVTPSVHAATAHDTVPLEQSIGWMTGRLTDGALSTQYGADYSTTGYLAEALQSVGGHSTELAPILHALETHVDEQIHGFVGGTDVYAGSAAKLAAIVQTAGDDPTNVDGTDLIQVLEGQVGTTGRTFDTSPYGDFANTIGQAYAVRALTTATSTKAAAATDFLLDQQCPAGWFRLGFSASSATDQSCAADATSKPDPDATSFVLLELAPLADGNAKIARSIGRAESWLAGRQRADGSFGGGTSTEGSNANSTGLAGWALGQLGHTSVAEAAATWLRTMQAHELSSCPTALSGQTGALAYDAAALAAGRTSGVSDSYQWQLAAAQALPALKWLPVATGHAALTGPRGFQPGGARATYRVAGAAPAETLCLAVGSAKHAFTAGTDGAAALGVSLPAATTTLPFSLTTAGGVAATGTTKVLGAARPSITLSRTRLARGATLTVRISGLAAGEDVTLKLGKRVVRTGLAGGSGAFTARVKLTRGLVKPGKVKVTVVGQFANRTNAKTIRVVR